MANTSATGGPLTPTSTQALPGDVTLVQYIQNLLVQLSGIAGTLVRPNWQENPPKTPAISENWIAFGITVFNPDPYAFTGDNGDGEQIFARQEGIDVECSFYGPLAAPAKP